MRCYFFTNMYMLAQQAGIQSQHSGQRLCNKYGMGFCGEQNLHAIAQYKEWARDHETSIVLNAGYQINMMRLLNLLKSSNDVNQFAWAEFHESQEALNGALTSIAVVLPERIYLTARDYGSAIEKWFSLTQDGIVTGLNSETLPEKNLYAAITDTIYLEYHTSDNELKLIKRSLSSSSVEVLDVFNTYEIGIILFMNRLRLV